MDPHQDTVLPAKQSTLTRGDSGLDFPEDQEHPYGH